MTFEFSRNFAGFRRFHWEALTAYIHFQRLQFLYTADEGHLPLSPVCLHPC